MKNNEINNSVHYFWAHNKHREKNNNLAKTILEICDPHSNLRAA